MASIWQSTANLFTEIRLILGKDSNTLSDANLLTLANKHYLWILKELNQAEYISGEISTTNLVQNQQEYTLPADGTAPTSGGYMDVLRVEMALDNVNWYVGEKIDFLSNPLPANGNAPYDNYTTSSPAWAYYDDSIFIYPTPTVNVTNGLKFYFVERPDEIDATTDVPEIPRDFLIVLSAFIKADAYQILGRQNEAQLQKQEAYQLLERAKQLTVTDLKQFKFTTKKNISNYR